MNRPLDLRGPDGNAFALMGYARSLMRQMEYEPEEIQAVLDEMTAGDYHDLVDTFVRHFGDFVDIIR